MSDLVVPSIPATPSPTDSLPPPVYTDKGAATLNLTEEELNEIIIRRARELNEAENERKRAEKAEKMEPVTPCEPWKIETREVAVSRQKGILKICEKLVREGVRYRIGDVAPALLKKIPAEYQNAEIIEKIYMMALDRIETVISTIVSKSSPGRTIEQERSDIAKNYSSPNGHQNINAMPVALPLSFLNDSVIRSMHSLVTRHYSLDQLPIAARTEHICRSMIEASRGLLCEVPLEFRTVDLCVKALKNGVGDLCDVPDDVLGPSFYARCAKEAWTCELGYTRTHTLYTDALYRNATHCVFHFIESSIYASHYFVL